MFKKIFFIGLAVGVVGLFCFGRGFSSYVGTAAGMIKEQVRGSIPMEFEIRRAESLIEGIVPEIRTCKKVVAEEEVAVEYLDNEIRALAKAQHQNKDKIEIQKAALERDDRYYFFGGSRYSHAALGVQLERVFDEFKSNEALMESKRRLHQARLESLEAAKIKLEKVRLEKSRLENQVQGLYAQLRQVEAMETHANRFTFDDSKLAQAKQLLGRCQKRLDVAQKMIENDRDFAGGVIVIEGPEDRDILEEVNRYFTSREGEEYTEAELASLSGGSDL